MNADTPAGPDLRERTRQAVRAELVNVAWELFVRQGYDATTVDEIAAAVGMSQRSFFRYFASKDDVVLGKFQAFGEIAADALAKRPADEDAWTALRRAFDWFVGGSERDPRYGLELMRVTDQTPALKARRLEQQTHWQDLLAPHVATRLTPPSTDPANDLRPTALAAAALACMNVANAAWVAGDGKQSLGKLIDEAMRAVHQGDF